MSQHALTEQQLRYFDTFGFLALPGLLDDVIDEVIEAFEGDLGAARRRPPRPTP